MKRRPTALVAVVLSTALVLAACASSADAPDEPTGEPIVIGALTALSGPSTSFGTAWLEGFKLGIDYATDGSNAVDGRPIEIEEADDQSDPALGLTEATDLVASGVNIIAGTISSGVSLGLAEFAAENDVLYIVGSAGADELTGINENTFRGSRQGAQDVAAAVAALGDDIDGADVCVLAHDIAFGQGNAAATKEAFGDKPNSFTEIYAPFPTTDVAPFVQKVNDSNCNVLILWWAGDSGPLWAALNQQGILDKMIVESSIDRTSWPVFEAIDSPNVRLWAPFVANASEGEAATLLTESIEEVDYTHSDGFIAAQMVVHALTEAGGNDDVAAMVAALEGYNFDSPRGDTTIRAEDHAVIAPMVRFHFEGGEPVIDEILSSEELTPPIK
jgi:branched-chain amino acid transport system substrate-binding protein